MSKSKNMNRRALIGNAGKLFAANAGAIYLHNILKDKSNTTAGKRITDAILKGDGVALAQSNITGNNLDSLVIVCAVSAKMDQFGIFARPNAAAVGIVGNPLAATSNVLTGAYQQFGFTQMFGDHLLPVEGKLGMAAVTVSTTSGNHVYDGLRLTMSETGCLPSWLTGKLGSLLRLDYGTTATADMSNATFGTSGLQQITYNRVDQAVGAIKGAIDPLQKLSPKAESLKSYLNSLVTKDKKFLESLDQLAGKLQSAITPLESAQALAAQNPMAVTPADLVNATLVRSINPLIPQLASAISLFKLGLSSVATVCIGNTDTNAGGNHDQRGGQNVAFGGRSPNEVKACIADAIVYLHEQLGTKFTMAFVADGGRANNGGDTQVFTNLIVGDPNKIRTAFINPATIDDSSKMGNAQGAVDLSNGTRMNPNQSHVMATVAKIAGLDMPYPYIKAVLPGV